MQLRSPFSGLGDILTPWQATSYAQWALLVRGDGGAAVVLPNTAIPAARYDASVWVPQVNNGVWPMPDVYSADGTYAYYRAPAIVVQEVASGALTTPTPGEVAAGAAALEPEWLKAILASLGTVGKLALLGGVLYLALPAIRGALTARRGPR